jgi:hypothetical protein
VAIFTGLDFVWIVLAAGVIGVLLPSLATAIIFTGGGHGQVIKTMVSLN